MQPLLNLNILQKPLLYAFDAASLLALAYLITGPLRLTRAASPSAPAVQPGSPGRLKSRRRGQLLIPVAALAGGALAGAITLYVSEAWYNIFGLPLDPDTHAWVIATFAAVGAALANLVHTRWRRKLAALASALIFVATATLGINAAYGLNPTLGTLLGLSTGQHVALPPLNPKQIHRRPLVEDLEGSGRTCRQ